MHTMHVNTPLLLLPMPFEKRPNDNCNVFRSEEREKEREAAEKPFQDKRMRK